MGESTLGCESTGQPQAAAASASCGNCGMKNHATSECRKLKMSQGNANVVCFQCNQVGHKKNACPMNRSAGPQRAAALQQIGAEVPIERPVVHISAEKLMVEKLNKLCKTIMYEICNRLPERHKPSMTATCIKFTVNT